MGKSPGRWIKTLLFGKKSRSHAKGRGASKAATDRGYNCGEEPVLAVNSPLISEPPPVSGLISLRTRRNHQN
ncbi:hypothetical protein C4D60_Mb08t26500 [Musa balbisiana]|uniref:Uncharacterized protein n=1 Tax=Musa balbisiana TaxID=52838 RepID=A0A4S8K6N8_MUSBA|nr:hypothetical protein C4D60_Mb08t26500 [Musa balbisiana]